MMTLVALALTLQLCGDCDHDGKVDVGELVTSVSNALTRCDFDCYGPCRDGGADCPCPDACTEPAISGELHCRVSLCVYNSAQTARCVEAFAMVHPERCTVRP